MDFLDATGGFSRISPGQTPKSVCGMSAHIEGKRHKRKPGAGKLS